MADPKNDKPGTNDKLKRKTFSVIPEVF